ncbi:hypothetical protein V2J09_003383 [Rumex salicifolius]
MVRSLSENGSHSTLQFYVAYTRWVDHASIIDCVMPSAPKHDIGFNYDPDQITQGSIQLAQFI